MATAIFTLKDSQEARSELSLLLQIDPQQLSIHDGFITVEFQDELEDQALHIISRAVSNYGFTPVISQSQLKQSQDPQAAEPKTMNKQTKLSNKEANK